MFLHTPIQLLTEVPFCMASCFEGAGDPDCLFSLMLWHEEEFRPPSWSPDGCLFKVISEVFFLNTPRKTQAFIKG